MSFSEIVYYIALLIFIVMTFLIIRNYYRNKFDDEGKRIDMQSDETKED